MHPTGGNFGAHHGVDDDTGGGGDMLVDGDASVVLIFVGAVSNHFLLYFPGLDCLQQYTGHISLITHIRKS